jgi:hypothetical protein
VHLRPQAGIPRLGDHFIKFIKQQDFNQSEADPRHFNRIIGTEKTCLTIWVDDGILASNRQQAIDDFLNSLGNQFKFRSYPVERYVGITVNRDRKER